MSSSSSSASAPSQPSPGLNDPERGVAPAWRSGLRLPGGFLLPGRVVALAAPFFWYLAIPLVIFFTALMPRLSLARSLDLVTDESVYIPTGMLDVRLVRDHDFSSPLWLQNYEAPALPKLIIGWGSLYGAYHLPGHSGWLYGARLPAAWLSALTLVAFYLLTRPIFGRRAAALAALALALSPWLAFFGALAYLDTYLFCFITLAAPLIWHAARRPWVYPALGLFAGLAFGSKYTALALLLPCILYLAYYYTLVARRPPPWQTVLAPVVAALTVYISDPAIWINPPLRLWDSFLFQFNHATNGHDVFWNGRVWEHVPVGIGVFILLAKLSLLLTIPAAVTLGWTVWRLYRARSAPGPLDDRAAFALFWLVGLLLPFGSLPIIVGTHYMLPLASPVAMVAAWGLVLGADTLARRGAAPFAAQLTARLSARLGARAAAPAPGLGAGWSWARAAIEVALMVVVIVALVAPPAYGLATVRQAEGYTAGWLNGENSTLQVAYPAYTDAIYWIIAHSHGRTTVTLISTRGGLDYWMGTRQNLFPQRIRLAVGTPAKFPFSQYIIWPEHLVQRKFPMPPDFQSLIVARIQGGATTYCYILRWPHPNR